MEKVSFNYIAADNDFVFYPDSVSYAGARLDITYYVAGTHKSMRMEIPECNKYIVISAYVYGDIFTQLLDMIDASKCGDLYALKSDWMFGDSLFDTVQEKRTYTVKERTPVDLSGKTWINDVLQGEKRAQNAKGKGRLLYKWTIKADLDMGKIALSFDRFPGNDVIATLKAEKWGWHPSRQCWCKGLTEKAHKSALALHRQLAI